MFFGANQFVALREFQNMLHKVFGFVYQRLEYNKGRHVLFVKQERYKHLDLPVFYVVYKRDFFHTFYKQFPRLYEFDNGFSKIGESLNESSVDFACDRADYIVFLHMRHAYCILPTKFRSFAKHYNTVRVQERSNKYKSGNFSGGLTTLHEVTLSVPVSELKNVLHLDYFQRFLPKGDSVKDSSASSQSLEIECGVKEQVI